jgi:hypothetical protein
MFCKTSAQEISGAIIRKAIHYHDPKGNWDHFKVNFPWNEHANGTERLRNNHRFNKSVF